MRNMRHQFTLANFISCLIVILLGVCLTELRTVNYKVSRLSSNKWSSRQSQTSIADSDGMRQAWIRGDHVRSIKRSWLPLLIVSKMFLYLLS